MSDCPLSAEDPLKSPTSPASRYSPPKERIVCPTEPTPAPVSAALAAFADTVYWPLLRDENVLARRSCRFLHALCPQGLSAELLVTGFGLLVEAAAVETPFKRDFFVVPFAAVEEMRQSTRQGLLASLLGAAAENFSIEISTRDLRLFNLELLVADRILFAEVRELWTLRRTSAGLRALSIPKHTFVFDLAVEWERQGLRPQEQGLLARENYGEGLLCTSYPAVLLFPVALDLSELRRVADFRARGRLPALTFYWRKGNTFLWRGAQPRPGLAATRCAADELLLALLHNAKRSPNSSLAAVDVHLYDARDRLSVVGNTFSGKGGEIPEHYPNCLISFNNVPHAAAVQSSYLRLSQAIQALLDENFALHMASSEWLVGLARVLGLAARMANSMSKGFSVFVHCSDGWDRTSQAVALTQMVLDPYYRTLGGFLALLHKDFSLFGHQFTLRQQDRHEAAPIFLQFLDCTAQLIRLNSGRFGFSSRLLVDMALMAYCGSYTNFATFPTEGPCFFSAVLEKKERYLCPFELEDSSPLTVPTRVFALEYWKDFLFFFFRESAGYNFDLLN